MTTNDGVKVLLVGLPSGFKDQRVFRADPVGWAQRVGEEMQVAARERMKAVS